MNAQKAATRPSNATICDYYANLRYGENTTASQGKLMQSVVSLAFAGKGDLPNINPEISGILNPGTFENEPVFLRPWFNGSIDSTNLNNQPVGIDWLDGGGTAPLYAFLNGSTDSVKIEGKTNELYALPLPSQVLIHKLIQIYLHSRLFAHFFRTFAFVFGCTLPPARPAGETGTPLSLAYVHKFMELNHTHLGHFINQLTLSAVQFGFSVQDSNTLESQMNARYNVRCQPGITLNAAQGPQLFSLCQSETCPLAAPVADCESYVDLGPQGAVKAASASGSATVSSTASSTSLAPSTTSTTSTASNTPSVSPSPTNNSSPALGGGPIAGIAIGGAALTFGFIALLVFLLRKRRQEPPPNSMSYGGPPSNPSYVTQSPYPTSPYQGNMQPYTPTTTDGHMSYMSHGGQPMQERQEIWTPPPVELGASDNGFGGHGGPPMEKSKVQ